MKPLAFIFVLVLLASLCLGQGIWIKGSPAGAASQHVLDTDTFGGTAGTVLHTYSANWIIADTTNCFDAKISNPNGGVSLGSSPGCDYRSGQTWTNNQFAQLTLVAVPTTKAYVCVELNTFTTIHGYCAGAAPAINSGTYYLYRYDPAAVQLATFSQTPTAGDVLNLQDVAGSLVFKVNGISIITASDSTYTSGNPGLRIEDTSTNKMLSTWSAGSVF